MILELAWTYVPVVVVALFWAVAIRPLLRLGKPSPTAALGGPLRRRGEPRARHPR